MEVEAIRDALLATSGRPDRALYGLSIQPLFARKANMLTVGCFQGPLDGTNGPPQHLLSR